MTRLKIFYLGYAFPPGIATLYPDLQPAGHSMETQMVAALRGHFDIRSAGVFSFPMEDIAPPADLAPGVAHEVTLLDRSPEMWHRWRSLEKLKRVYLAWLEAGWRPDVVAAYNMTPIYNAFVLWLKRQPQRPKLVLLLVDSARLRRAEPWTRKLRQALKPFAQADSVMAAQFDACIAWSRSTEEFFAQRSIPWMWMPGGCVPERAISKSVATAEGLIRFGYFGTFGIHAGLEDLIRVFTATDRPNHLSICGWGKNAEDVKQLCARDPRLEFQGLLATPDDCLRFAQGCDVLINPRPAAHGNENNFPSKIFEYALSGRAILTTRFSGVDEVLGNEAFYFDERDFDRNLGATIDRVAEMDRAGLDRRGAALQERVTRNYGWQKQAAKMAEFIRATSS
jgi:glycosyltransferase involved in cell wall biosynthesis